MIRDQAVVESALSQITLKILRKCRTAMPIGELMEMLDWKDRTKFRNRFIKPLLEKHLLEMTVPDKPNSRLQKYRLTEQGKKLIN